MRGGRRLIVTLPFALAFPLALVAQGDADARRAVTFVEIRETGARKPFAGPRGPYGIDINSTARIEIDRLVLSSALDGDGATAAEIDALRASISQLEQARLLVERLPAAYQEAVKAYGSIATGGDSRVVNARISTAVAIRDGALTALENAVAARLAREGVGRDAAARRAQDLVFEARQVSAQTGWNWDSWGRLVQSELEALGSAIRRYDSAHRLSVMVSARRVGRRGEAWLAIPGYNSVEEGTIRAVEKVAVAASEKELALYQRFDSLLTTFAERSAVERGLRASLAPVLGDVGVLRDALRAGETVATEAIAAARSIEEWRRTSLDRWLNDILAAITDESTRQSLRDVIASLDLGGLTGPAKALSVLATTAQTLPTSRPPEALATIIGVVRTLDQLDAMRAVSADYWQSQVRLLARADSQFAALAALRAQRADIATLLDRPDSPLKVVAASHDKLKGKAEQFVAALAPVRALLERLTLDAPSLVGDIGSVAPGTLPVSLGVDARVPQIDLRRIREGLERGDRIDVTVQFFRGAAPVSRAIEEQFFVESYGLNADVIASLAWISREGDGAFTPSANLSWLARNRRWPAAGKPRIGQPDLLSYGVSTMTLDFDPDESVELGLAATLGLFGDRVLLGGGLNLQVKASRHFGFFAVRLFSADGALNVGR